VRGTAAGHHFFAGSALARAGDGERPVEIVEALAGGVIGHEGLGGRQRDGGLGLCTGRGDEEKGADSGGNERGVRARHGRNPFRCKKESGVNGT
jgi:hypothetical protein